MLLRHSLPSRRQDPLVAARFVIGYVWPLLLALVFAAGLVGDGVNGVFVIEHGRTVKAIFGCAALAALATAFVRRPPVIIVAAGVIILVGLGRAWSVTGQWAEQHDFGAAGTTFLVGAFLWVAVALAHFMFAAALLAIVNADRKAIG